MKFTQAIRKVSGLQDPIQVLQAELRKAKPVEEAWCSAQYQNAGAEFPFLDSVNNKQVDGLWVCHCGHETQLTHVTGKYPFAYLRCSRCSHILCDDCQTSEVITRIPVDATEVFSSRFQEAQIQAYFSVCQQCGLTHRAKMSGGCVDFTLRSCADCQNPVKAGDSGYFIGSTADFRRDPEGKAGALRLQRRIGGRRAFDSPVQTSGFPIPAPVPKHRPQRGPAPVPASRIPVPVFKQPVPASRIPVLASRLSVPASRSMQTPRTPATRPARPARVAQVLPSTPPRVDTSRKPFDTLELPGAGGNAAELRRQPLQAQHRTRTEPNVVHRPTPKVRSQTLAVPTPSIVVHPPQTVAAPAERIVIQPPQAAPAPTTRAILEPSQAVAVEPVCPSEPSRATTSRRPSHGVELSEADLERRQEARKVSIQNGAQPGVSATPQTRSQTVAASSARVILQPAPSSGFKDLDEVMARLRSIPGYSAVP